VDERGLEQAIEGEMRLMQPSVRSDARLLDALLDDDFLEIGASGRIWTRASVIADLVESPNVDIEVVDLSARHIDARIVLVMYTTISPERRVLRSSWWREVGGTWKCCFHQGTIAGTTPPAGP
jgi:hypothetical protein